VWSLSAIGCLSFTLFWFLKEKCLGKRKKKKKEVQYGRSQKNERILAGALFLVLASLSLKTHFKIVPARVLPSQKFKEKQEN
jgi:hypothetical protein